MPTTPTPPSLAQLQRAVVVAQQIEKLQSELATILGKSTAAPSTVAAVAKPGGKRTHKMSAAARAKISAAARARWARIKGTAAPAATTSKAASGKTAKKKRTMSAETRAKLAAAGKKRWEERRKQQSA